MSLPLNMSIHTMSFTARHFRNLVLGLLVVNVVTISVAAKVPGAQSDQRTGMYSWMTQRLLKYLLRHAMYFSSMLPDITVWVQAKNNIFILARQWCFLCIGPKSQLGLKTVPILGSNPGIQTLLVICNLPFILYFIAINSCFKLCILQPNPWELNCRQLL